jgi:hypothetical protein
MTPEQTEILQRTYDIMDASKDWFRDDQAMANLKALWSDAINENGVFINEEEEILFNRDGCKAEISIGGAHGLYAFGCSFITPTQGYGEAPSICDEFFETRDASRTAAIEHLIKHLPTKFFPNEEGQQPKVERMRAELEGLLRQPSLF